MFRLLHLRLQGFTSIRDHDVAGSSLILHRRCQRPWLHQQDHVSCQSFDRCGSASLVLPAGGLSGLAEGGSQPVDRLHHRLLDQLHHVMRGALVHHPACAALASGLPRCCRCLMRGQPLKGVPHRASNVQVKASLVPGGSSRDLEHVLSAPVTRCATDTPHPPKLFDPGVSERWSQSHFLRRA